MDTASFQPKHIVLQSVRGNIECIYHNAPESSHCVIWLCGALGGLDGPSFGIFKMLSEQLVDDNISSLRLHYSNPGKFELCVQDTLEGIEYLKQRNIIQIALVGHSFGGAVAIQAGVESTLVKAVVGLASQTFGAQNVSLLSPRPLLLIHGERDRNLPSHCSELIYKWAKEPKKLIMLKNNGHFLREAHHELIPLLKRWLINSFKENQV